MLYPNKKNMAGYTAVVSAIIVMAIILAVALVFSSSNFLSRFDTLFLEEKDIARGVAEGCLNYGRLKLAQSSSYAGNEAKNIGSYSCTVLPIESAPGQKIIKATATVQNKISNLKLVVNAATLELISFEELPTF
jgi:hypothetical protein